MFVYKPNYFKLENINKTAFVHINKATIFSGKSKIRRLKNATIKLFGYCICAYNLKIKVFHNDPEYFPYLNTHNRKVYLLFLRRSWL